MQNLKHIFFAFVATLISFIEPVEFSVKGLMILCIVNFVCGLLAGLIILQERFSFKKAFRCMVEAAIYVVIVSSVYQIGEFMEDQNEALQVVKVVTYIMIYFYAENILKNLVGLFPANRVFSFLHFLLALEFIKRVPGYREYLKHELKKGDKDE